MSPDIYAFPPGVITAISSKENVRYYLSDWLRQKSGEGGVFVYVTSHGSGFNLTTGELVNGSRWDVDGGDEGTEHLVNGTWRGVDESIYLKASDSFYYDDEMKQDLNWTIGRCNSAIILQNCYIPDISNLTCFSGGFIDDLNSVYSRTVLTSANETNISYGWDSTIDPTCHWPFSPFTYHLFTGTIGYTVSWDSTGFVPEEWNPIYWPYNQSLRGVFEYALQHDQAYLSGQECPWFDDTGNGLPTYVNNTEVLDFPVSDLAGNHSNLMRWLRYDVNYDGKVDMKDVAIVARAYGTKPGDALWNRQADVFAHEDWKVDMADVGEIARHYGSQT